MARLLGGSCHQVVLTTPHQPARHIVRTAGRWLSVLPGRRVVCAAGESPDSDDSQPRTGRNQLEATIKRKAKEVEAQLKELGDEGIEERMQNSVQIPANPSYRLARLIADIVPTGRPVIIFEVARPSPDIPSEVVVERAKLYAECGADALAVATDSYFTPEGFKDLFSVIRAVKIPVLMRDWIVHPLQIVEAKEAGAAGVIGVINQVNGKGTAVLSSFAAAIGLDAPVEVVNSKEVEVLGKLGVPFYGVNLGVGLSISVPGISNMIADGLLGELPAGAISIVGVRSIQEARRAKYSGADALLIKQEMLNVPRNEVRGLVTQLEYVISGDD